jgi:hypothetical protein
VLQNEVSFEEFEVKGKFEINKIKMGLRKSIKP